MRFVKHSLKIYVYYGYLHNIGNNLPDQTSIWNSFAHSDWRETFLSNPQLSDKLFQSEYLSDNPWSHLR